MEFQFSPTAIRVLGCLLEKEVTTPDYYPLSLNGLQNASNQKSNRDPVMQLSEEEIECAIDELKEKHFVWKRSVTGARVYKYEHNIKSVIPVTPQEIAVLCVLFLRGPQTIGELRLRTERLCTFASIDEAENVVRHLMAREDGPFVHELPRQPGRKESRFVHLLCGREWAVAQGAVSEAGSEPVPHLQPGGKSVGDRIAELETAIVELKQDLQQVRSEFVEFRKMLE